MTTAATAYDVPSVRSAATAAYVVPTVHPAFALRGNEAWLAVIEKDLERAFRIAKHGWSYDPEIIIGVPHAGQTFEATIQKLQAFFASLDLRQDAPPIAFDTETDSKDQYTCNLRAISFAQVGSGRTCAIAYSKSVWGSAAFAWIHNWLQKILASRVIKLVHNRCYDDPVVRRHGLPLNGLIIDTLPMHHTVESDLPHDLGFIAQRWLDVPCWKPAFNEEQKKANRKWSDAEWVSLLKYNALDSYNTAGIYTVLNREIHENVPGGPGVLPLQLWFVDLAVRMSQAGLPIDEADRQQLSNELHEKRDKATEIVRSTLNWPEFNPRKPAHRRELLYTRLQLPVRKYTPKKAEPSTSFKAIVEHAGVPAVRALIEHDEAAALLSNVVDKYAMLPGGRLHITWNTTGTDGSRASSSPNLQNWPKFPVNVRRLAKAPPGRIFVGADYSQLELRILAAFAGARQLLKLFREGADAHAYMAEQVFGPRFTQAEPKIRKVLRDLTKRVVYGMQYGAGPETIFRVLREDKRLSIEVRSLLNIKLVAKVRDTFLEVNPEVVEWRDRTLDQVNTHGFITIPPLGRTRRFLALPVDGPKAWNWPIQVCGHDHLMLAMYRIDAHKPARSDILVDGHDSVLLECDEADGDEVVKLVNRAMTCKLDGPAGPVDLVAEASKGRTWANTA